MSTRRRSLLPSGPLPSMATERVNDATEELWADWHVDDGTGSAHDVALLDVTIVTEHDDTDVVGFQVERHTLDARVELYHLLGLDVLEAVHTSDTISDSEHLTSLLKIDLGGFAGDSLLEEVSEISGALLVGRDGRGSETSLRHGNRVLEYFGK